MLFQAGLLILTVEWEPFVDDSEPEPLSMEHVHFPLLIWSAGLILSAFFFLVEIIYYRLTLKDPSVTVTDVEDNKDNKL